MKKTICDPLMIMTILFCVFICGFFLGRNSTALAISVRDLTNANATVRATTTLINDLITTHPVSDTVSTVPTHEPVYTTPTPTFSTVSESENDLININTANHAVLCTLPGIGDSLAKRIIDYRTKNGPFKTVAEIMNVNGIGQKRYEAICELVTVGG